MVIVIGIKTTKSTRFLNQDENKGKLSSKSTLWNKNNNNKKIQQVWIKNPTRFYYKEKQTKQNYDKKTY